MKPRVSRCTPCLNIQWIKWKVSVPGKKPVFYEHWYAAVAHAVYVARNPVAMEDAV